MCKCADFLFEPEFWMIKAGNKSKTISLTAATNDVFESKLHNKIVKKINKSTPLKLASRAVKSNTYTHRTAIQHLLYKRKQNCYTATNNSHNFTT